MSKLTPYILLAALCLALFFWKLGSVPLFGLDEGLYASCAREMAASGNYIVPTQNGIPFFDKPPLCYWLQAASIRGFGTNSLAARFPSAVGGMLLVTLTVLIAGKVYGRRPGLLAGFVLVTALFTPAMAHLCSLDQIFAVTITAALGTFLLAYLGMVSKGWYLAFWAALGLSGISQRPRGSCADLPHYRGVPAHKKGPAGTRRVAARAGHYPVSIDIRTLVYAGAKGHTRRFLERVHHPPEPAAGDGQRFLSQRAVLFLPAIFLAGFFPWSVFTPLAWVKYVRLRPKSAQDQASLFFAVWSVTIIAVFSASQSKLASYIYPMYPAAAALVGLAWSRAIENKEPEPLRRWAAAVVILSLLLAAAMQIGQRFLPTPIPGLSLALMPMSVSVALGSMLGFVLLAQKRPAGAFAALGAGAAGFVLAAIVLGLPVAARTTSIPVYQAAQQIGRLASRSETVVAYHLTHPQPALGFYAQRPVPPAHTAHELASILARGKKTLVVTQDARSLPRGGVLQAKAGPFLIYGWGRSPRTKARTDSLPDTTCPQAKER